MPQCGIVAAMVTRIRKHVKARLYLKEHREAKGISPEAMAGRLDMERESVYRWEREIHRMNPEKQAAYADALGLDSPAELWFPPPDPANPPPPSIDALVSDAPPDVRELARDLVSRLVKKAG